MVIRVTRAEVWPRPDFATVVDSVVTGGFRLADWLVLRRFGFRQAQEYEDGSVERPHFLGGQ